MFKSPCGSGLRGPGLRGPGAIALTGLQQRPDDTRHAVGERDRHQRFGRRAAHLVEAYLLEVIEGGGDAAFLEKRLEEIALGREVVVDRGVGDASAVGDVADAGASEPLL